MKKSQNTWIPSQAFREGSNLTRYASWLKRRYSLDFRDDYDALWSWSVNQPAAFWESIWKY
ncbi:MAG TPA: hypothetical protein VIR29_05710, partial [Anseongella sp.]